MKRIPHLICTSLLTLILVACSFGDEAPEPTLPPAPTEPALPPTVTPGGTSVGDLLAQVDAAWPQVQSVRTTFWTEAGDGGDSPPPESEVTTETAIAPSRRHVVRTANGQVVEEQMAVDGRVFMKGQIVVAAIAPMVGTDAWVEVNPEAATVTTAISSQVAWLLTPVQSPFASVSQDTRSLEAFAGEAVNIDGRTCDIWTFGEPDGIEHEIALDERHLPCRLVQRAGGHANVTLFAVNPPGVDIVAPEIPPPPG